MNIDNPTYNKDNEWEEFLNALATIDETEPGSDANTEAELMAKRLGKAARKRAVERRPVIRPELKRGKYISPLQYRAVRRHR